MSLDQLTPDRHQQIILAMKAEQTVVVKGVAGSGKSLTLLKKAKQVSSFSDSYAIIVFTKSLKQFFADELQEIGQSEGHVYYLKEWENSTKPTVDYMFVDECQDFNSEQIEDFRNHGRYCWFFGDTNQSIMDFMCNSTGLPVQSVEKTAEQLGVHPQSLGINHRLTVENAKVGEYIYPDSRLALACYRHGPKPVLVNSDAQLKDLIRLNQTQDAISVGILAFSNSQVESIRNAFNSAGIPVEWKTKDEMAIDFKSTNPKILTFHCAKGLQFDNVFMPFCESYHTLADKKALYVGCTRPLSQLFIIFRRNQCPLLPPEVSDVYSKPMN